MVVGVEGSRASTWEHTLGIYNCEVAALLILGSLLAAIHVAELSLSRCHGGVFLGI